MILKQNYRHVKLVCQLLSFSLTFRSYASNLFNHVLLEAKYHYLRKWGYIAYINECQEILSHLHTKNTHTSLTS